MRQWKHDHMWEAIDVTDVGATLRRRRLELGWTMRALEDASGVDDAVISRIENGEIVQPRVDKIARIATALGLDPLALISAASHIPGMPSIRSFLAASYPGLPDDAIGRIERYADRVIREHNINPHDRKEV